PVAIPPGQMAVDSYQSDLGDSGNSTLFVAPRTASEASQSGAVGEDVSGLKIRPQGPELSSGPLPSAGPANWLWIPAIGIQTTVVPGATATSPSTGQLEWETRPF